MFRGKDDHGLVKYSYVIEASLFGTLSFVMDDGGMRVVIVAVPCLGNPVGKIDILSIHEKAFIQVTGLLQGFFSYKHKSACQDIHGNPSRFTTLTE